MTLLKLNSSPKRKWLAVHGMTSVASKRDFVCIILSLNCFFLTSQKALTIHRVWFYKGSVPAAAHDFYLLVWTGISFNNNQHLPWWFLFHHCFFLKDSINFKEISAGLFTAVNNCYFWIISCDSKAGFCLMPKRFDS